MAWKEESLKGVQAEMEPCQRNGLPISHMEAAIPEHLKI